jgi:hypothetical protein
MDTVCKPDSEHQQNSRNTCKIKASSPLLARIFQYFPELSLTVRLTPKLAEFAVRGRKNNCCPSRQLERQKHSLTLSLRDSGKQKFTP